ncbi:MAG: hypothetical protein IKT56_02700 [Clostridia bacterium]|nr:hypothetical protein [Clostridia bacterium]
MAEFDTELYKVKAVFWQDETEPTVAGYYYQDKNGREFIIGDDFKHYEINPYTLCRNTGIKIADTYLYEYDIVSYFEPMRDKKQYGFIDFDEFYKCFIVRTGIECRATRLLRDCSKIEFTNRNIVLNEVDFSWFAEREKSEFEKSKSYVIDNSYCPSKFRR